MYVHVHANIFIPTPIIVYVVVKLIIIYYSFFKYYFGNVSIVVAHIYAHHALLVINYY